MSKHTCYQQNAFTLTEVLVAVSITAVIATLAIISSRDSILAGQRSAVQRELQALNTALINYKAAGGSIAPESATTDEIALLSKELKCRTLTIPP